MRDMLVKGAKLTNMSALYDGEDFEDLDVSDNITGSNLIKNYNVISNWLDKELTEKHKLTMMKTYNCLMTIERDLNKKEIG